MHQLLHLLQFSRSVLWSSGLLSPGRVTPICHHCDHTYSELPFLLLQINWPADPRDTTFNKNHKTQDFKSETSFLLCAASFPLAPKDRQVLPDEAPTGCYCPLQTTVVIWAFVGHQRKGKILFTVQSRSLDAVWQRCKALGA